MFQFVWPIALVVFSNIVYQICAKSVPESADPFAALTVTYLVGAGVSCIFYFLLGNRSGFFRELSKMNWAPYVLGIVIVGLEVGFIFAYKAGWQVSTASIVQSSFLAIALIFVGAVLYHEDLSWNKLAGIAICMIGLIFINMK